MKIISADEVHAALSYPGLVDALQETFAKNFNQPPRQVFLLDDADNNDAFALLPAWNDNIIAVKAFTYFEGNAAPYERLYSKIMIFDRSHGEPLALVDGTTCTFWRTGGVSGLATRLLSREDSSTMLLLGTGNLSTYMIRANASVRPLEKIMIWGNPDGLPPMAEAQAVIDEVSAELPEIKFSVATDLEDACGEADIIVCATASPDILVKGAWIKEGTHLDLIGNHHADKRECDTEVITNGRVYADSYVNAFKEAGEILVPISEGVFSKEDVVAELAEMCSGKATLRTNDKEITVFKAIGQAVTDLVAASMAYSALK
jgi:1-pyrroline-2-carboxylate reductase [NAD(P)H]|tara:strand:+ start:631 stop:1581 length:951 start_codon:yes stop_codon:yes gene_type:complete